MRRRAEPDAPKRPGPKNVPGRQYEHGLRAGDRRAGAPLPAAAVPNQFDCSDGIAVTAEFVGPETVEIALPDGKYVLQRARTASGAK